MLAAKHGNCLNGGKAERQSEPTRRPVRNNRWEQLSSCVRQIARAGGGTAGERVSLGLFSRVSRCNVALGASTEGDGVTDIQQVIPQARPGGRGFRAYSAKHLDMLVQRAGLSP